MYIQCFFQTAQKKTVLRISFLVFVPPHKHLEVVIVMQLFQTKSVVLTFDVTGYSLHHVYFFYVAPEKLLCPILLLETLIVGPITLEILAILYFGEKQLVEFIESQF
jgi:hypothetical protein